jgi:DNA polymerase-3 subunit delta'
LTGLYPWFDDHYNHFYQCLLNGKFPHALLLTSQADIGMNCLIAALSKLLLCHRHGQKMPCQQCVSCRIFQNNSDHPDLYQITEDPSNAHTIKLSSLTQLLEPLRRTATYQNKVVCLPYIERMTESANNALLKILEEPPSETFFIMSCFYIKHISKTVRSRCQSYAINVSYKQAYPWLISQLDDENQRETVSENQLKSIWQMTRSSPLLTLNYVKDPHFFQLRNEIIQMLKIKQNPVAMVEHLLSYGDIRAVLNWLQLILSDLVYLRCINGEKWLVNQDQIENLRAIATRFQRKELLLLYQKLLHMHHSYEHQSNLNAQLLLEHILIAIHNNKIND